MSGEWKHKCHSSIWQSECDYVWGSPSIPTSEEHKWSTILSWEQVSPVLAKPYMNNLKQLRHLNMQQQVTVARNVQKTHWEAAWPVGACGQHESHGDHEYCNRSYLANGVRGEFINIVLDPRELNPHRDKETGVTRL